LRVGKVIAKKAVCSFSFFWPTLYLILSTGSTAYVFYPIDRQGAVVLGHYI